MSQTLIGKVSYTMTRQAVYVRVMVLQHGGVPLAVKATIKGFTYDQFTKDTVVEIKRPNQFNHSNFAVQEIFRRDVAVEDMKTGVCVHLKIGGVSDAEHFRNEMSKIHSARRINPFVEEHERAECHAARMERKAEREAYVARHNPAPKSEPKKQEKVRFFLSHYYFSDDRMAAVLKDALSFTTGEAERAFGGIMITCTTDQFAKFLIYRNGAGLRNGFMDLQAKLIDGKPQSKRFLDVSNR